MIEKRLAEERKRLGHSQEKFSALARVSRRAYAEWESGNTSPTARQLSALADAGADVLYILTGRRDTGNLPPRQSALLDHYEHLAEEDRRNLERTAFALAQPKVKNGAA
jgi:transcriptional regulator with XRE-family HTH domain